MTTKLDKPMKREISVDGRAYTLTLDAEKLRLTEKGRRKGVELDWKALIGGEAALASALSASVENVR